MTKKEAAELLPKIMETLGEDFINGFYLTPKAGSVVFEALGMTADEAKSAATPTAIFARIR